jgi:Spy/CpxP family protein refolding chaperone
MKTHAGTASILALCLSAAASIAVAQSPPFEGGPGYGRGSMMGGPGYGPGWGGPGMMGPYGAGPGSARGWGRNSGFAGGPLATLDLTDEQRQKIAAIQEDQRAKTWSAMGQMRAEQFKLRQMYFADKVDAGAVTEQQGKVDELRRQLVKSHVETRNQVSALLTPEQRQRFRGVGPWWLETED